MKYDAAMRDLEGIMHDLRVCNEELGKISDIEAEYEHLLEQKKSSIKQEASRRTNEVIALEKELGYPLFDREVPVVPYYVRQLLSIYLEEEKRNENDTKNKYGKC